MYYEDCLKKSLDKQQKILVTNLIHNNGYQ